MPVPDTIALSKVEVAVPDAIVAPAKLITDAEVNVAVILASLTSGQASPSESKSWWFKIPSPSVSFEQSILGCALGI